MRFQYLTQTESSYQSGRHRSVQHAVSPLDFRRYRSCTGKVKHLTREAAEAIAERQAKKWKLTEPVHLVAYRCEFCHYFHTGRRDQS